MTFVREKIVTAAVTKLVTSLNPAGAFIQAIIAIYNTIMFLVERLKQIGQVAMAVIDAIAAIAAGVIVPAANKVEQTMAGLLTLVISFLARLVGLGNVSEAVSNVIAKVRAPIDKALDRVVEWIVATATKIGKLVVGAAKGAVAKVVGWWRARTEFSTAGGGAARALLPGRGNGGAARPGEQAARPARGSRRREGAHQRPARRCCRSGRHRQKDRGERRHRNEGGCDADQVPDGDRSDGPSTGLSVCLTARSRGRTTRFDRRVRRESGASLLRDGNAADEEPRQHDGRAGKGKAEHRRRSVRWHVRREDESRADRPRRSRIRFEMLPIDQVHRSLLSCTVPFRRRISCSATSH